MNRPRYFLVLLTIFSLYSPLSAQETAEYGQFYLDLSGSAVFPYEPNGRPDSGGAGASFKAGAGFTAAFTEGFSTEMEWGYQKAGIGAPTENLSQDLALGGFAGSEGFELLATTIEIDGELKTQSLMGNVYYRYPRWSVSPYAGFGLGTFFHDGAFTSTLTIENGPGPSGVPIIEIPAEALSTTVAYEDFRFAYQIMGASRPGSPSAWSSSLAIAFAPAGGHRSTPTRLRPAFSFSSDSCRFGVDPANSLGSLLPT